MWSTNLILRMSQKALFLVYLFLGYNRFMRDKQVEKLIKEEEKRQKSVINLIASENYVSEDILKALGSKLTNKYAEGYPGK